MAQYQLKIFITNISRRNWCWIIVDIVQFWRTRYVWYSSIQWTKQNFLCLSDINTGYILIGWYERNVWNSYLKVLYFFKRFHEMIYNSLIYNNTGLSHDITIPTVWTIYFAVTIWACTFKCKFFFAVLAVFCW